MLDVVLSIVFKINELLDFAVTLPSPITKCSNCLLSSCILVFANFVSIDIFKEV